MPADGSNYYELEAFKNVTGSINLAPGKGTVLFKGSVIELEELKKLIQKGAGVYTAKTLSVSEKKLWQISSGDQEAVSQRNDITNFPISFGGKGGIPWVYSENQMTELPSYAGEVLTWGTGIKMPAGIIFPPRAGTGESMLFLKWDLSSFQSLADKVESAVFELQVSSGISGGRLAIYPVIGDSDDLLYDVMEFMPRWEKESLAVSAGGTVRLEIGGMVQEWINGTMDNRGLLIVYYGWPNTTNSFGTNNIGSLNITYYKQPATCDEVWQAGYGLASDLDRNCIVDFKDFAVFIQRWFECNNPQDLTCE
jgi:hypothetical protein